MDIQLKNPDGSTGKRPCKDNKRTYRVPQKMWYDPQTLVKSRDFESKVHAFVKSEELRYLGNQPKYLPTPMLPLTEEEKSLYKHRRWDHADHCLIKALKANVPKEKILSLLIRVVYHRKVWHCARVKRSLAETTMPRSQRTWWEYYHWEEKGWHWLGGKHRDKVAFCLDGVTFMTKEELRFVLTVRCLTDMYAVDETLDRMYPEVSDYMCSGDYYSLEDTFEFEGDWLRHSLIAAIKRAARMHARFRKHKRRQERARVFNVEVAHLRDIAELGRKLREDIEVVSEMDRHMQGIIPECEECNRERKCNWCLFCEVHCNGCKEKCRLCHKIARCVERDSCNCCEDHCVCRRDGEAHINLDFTHTHGLNPELESVLKKQINVQITHKHGLTESLEETLRGQVRNVVDALKTTTRDKIIIKGLIAFPAYLSLLWRERSIPQWVAATTLFLTSLDITEKVVRWVTSKIHELFSQVTSGIQKMWNEPKQVEEEKLLPAIDEFFDAVDGDAHIGIENMDVSHWVALGGGVVAIVLAVMGLRSIPPDEKSITPFLMRFGALGRCITSMEKLMEYGSHISSEIVRVFRIYVLGHDPGLLNVMYEENKWCDEVFALVQTNFEAESRFNLQMTLKVDALLNEGSRLLKKMSMLKTHAEMRNRFNIAYNQLTRFRAVCSASGAGHSVHRVVPVMVHLYGVTGTGKSSVAWPLFADLGVRLGIESEEKLMEAIYFRYLNTTDNYWNGYHDGVQMVCYDDAFTKVDSENNPDPSIDEILRMGNIACWPLPMADLVDKGRTFFKAPFVLLTTNRLDWNFKSITNPEAVRNRINLRFRVQPKKEYGVEAVIGGEKVFTLDHKKVTKDLASDPANLIKFVEFQELNPKSIIEDPIGVPMEYPEFMHKVWCECDKTLIHFQNTQKAFSSYFKKSHEDYKQNGHVAPDAAVEKLKETDEFGMKWSTSASEQESVAGNEWVRRLEVAAGIPPALMSCPILEEEVDPSKRYLDRPVIEPFFKKEEVEGNPHSLTESVERAMGYYGQGELREVRTFPRLWNEMTTDCVHIDFPLYFMQNVERVITGMSSMKEIVTDYRRMEWIGPCVCVKRDTPREALDAAVRQIVLAPTLADGLADAHNVLAFKLVKTACEHKSVVPDATYERSALTAQTAYNKVFNRILFLEEAIQYKKREHKLGLATCIVGSAVLAALLYVVAKCGYAKISGVFSKKTPFDDEDERNGMIASMQEVVRGQARQGKVHSRLDGRAYYYMDHSEECRVRVSDWYDRVRKVCYGEPVDNWARLLTDMKLPLTEPCCCEEWKEVHSAGGVFDQNAQEIATVCARNMYKLSEFKNGEWWHRINVLFVAGRIAITNKHLSIYLKGSENEWKLANYSRPNGMIFKAHEIKMHKVEELVDKNKDVMLLEFPVHVDQHRNIVDKFVTKEDQGKWKECESAFLTGYSPSETIVIRQTYVSRVQFIDGVVNLKSGEETHGKIRHYLMYNYPSVKGDCGAVVVAYDKRMERKIIGIHAGDLGGDKCEAFGQPVTSDFLRDAIEKVTKKNPMSKVEEPDNIPGELHMLTIGNFVVPAKEQKGHAVVGYIQSGVHRSYNSQIEPSPVHGVIAEPTTAPAILRPTELNGEIIDPMDLARMKVLPKERVFLNADFLERSIDDVAEMIVCDTVESDCEVKDFTVGLKGVEGDDAYAPLNRKSSPGYGWPHENGKRKWLGADEWVLDHPEVLERHEIAMKRLRSGKRLGAIFTDTLKDERRPIEKVRALKTRMFSAGEMIFTIIFRQYFIGFAAHMHRQPIVRESCVGLNCYSAQWHRLALLLQEKGEKVIAGDFTNYDGNLNVEFLWGVYEVIERFYAQYPGENYEEEKNIRALLWCDIVNSVHVVDDVVYVWSQSNPSGCPLTAPLNCIVHSIAARYVFLDLATRYCPEKATLRFYRQEVNHVNYGDDDVYNISDSVCEWFNQVTITESFKRIGMIYTDESKREGTVPWRSLDEINFLKRGFRYSQELGRYVAPLSLVTIREMPMWRHRTTDRYVGCKEVLVDATLELSLHGEEVFDREMPAFRKAARIVGARLYGYREALRIMNDREWS